MKKSALTLLPGLFTLLFLLPMLFSACGGNNKKSENQSDGYAKAEGMIWNTTYHLTFRGPESLADSALRVLEEVGRSLNVFDTTSLVSRVNRGNSVPVNTDFLRVYVMSKRVNKISGGAFDPTLGPLIAAWGFGPGHKATADTARTDSLLALCGIQKTRLSHYALVKENPAISFNFSAIAKGFGCDRVAEMLTENGVKDYLVEIGGEIRAAGVSPSGGDWRVSVDRPVHGASADSRESACIVAFTDMGMATSGNYRNFHKDGSRIYGHTISSKTGRPVQTDVISATVLASTAMEADALATAFMAAGSERTREINNTLRRPVMLILADSTIWSSPQFTALITED